MLREEVQALTCHSVTNKAVSILRINVQAHLNGNFLSIRDVDSQVDITKWSGPDFADEAVFSPDDELRPRGWRDGGHFVLSSDEFVCVEVLVYK